MKSKQKYILKNTSRHFAHLKRGVIRLNTNHFFPLAVFTILREGPIMWSNFSKKNPPKAFADISYAR